MPTPHDLADEPHDAEEVRPAVISGDEDGLIRQGDKAAVGAEFGLWGESGEECKRPDM